MRRALPVLSLLSFVLGLSAIHSAEESMKYPETHKSDVADTLHGTKVADPYRWLEDDVRTSKEVADWVTAQNKVTFGYLEKIPSRKPIQKRLTELWNYERQSAPFKAGGRYFVYRNNGLQNQSVLYVSETLDGKERVLIDPNKLTKDGTVAMTSVEAAPTGN